MQSTAVPTRRNDEERSQRMESSGAILWDFVDWHYVTLRPFAGPEVNRRGFNQVRSFPRNPHRWHAVCSLIGTYKIGFPGGRNRTSTRLPVLGRQLQKGACTSPLFISIALPFSSVWGRV